MRRTVMQANQPSNEKRLVERSRDDIAAIQSIIPGLGHIYKGHYALGISLMIVSPLLIWAGLILAFATMGFGLFVPIGYMLAVAYHAYKIDDHRKHHIGIF